MTQIVLLTSFEPDTPRLAKCLADNAPHLLEREILIRRPSEAHTLDEASTVLVFKDDPIFEDIVSSIRKTSANIVII